MIPIGDNRNVRPPSFVEAFFKLPLLVLLFLPTLSLHAHPPRVMLLRTYTDQNVTGWVMSEKLDGIRAYWDGRRLLFRSGRVIHAPEWFTRDYPPFPIDGELWSRRGDFATISSIVREKVPSARWHLLRHYIFDVPNAPGGLFERLKRVEPYVGETIRIVPQYPVRDARALQLFLEKVERLGGEGVVVRDPRAPYVAGRSATILKVKRFRDDECTVVGYTEGKGRYRGKVGALVCRLSDGTIFKIGSGLDLATRENPPPPGTVVTFRYKELTHHGKPRFPVYLRIRPKE
ncbi:DNA ligase [Hydrogenimonas sp.]